MTLAAVPLAARRGRQRRLGGSVVACVANFAGGPHLTYRIGLPHAGRWREVINTDATTYGGSGVGNLGVIEAIPEPWHGRRPPP